MITTVRVFPFTLFLWRSIWYYSWPKLWRAGARSLLQQPIKHLLIGVRYRWQWAPPTPSRRITVNVTFSIRTSVHIYSKTAACVNLSLTTYIYACSFNTWWILMLLSNWCSSKYKILYTCIVFLVRETL